MRRREGTVKAGYNGILYNENLVTTETSRRFGRNTTKNNGNLAITLKTLVVPLEYVKCQNPHTNLVSRD